MFAPEELAILSMVNWQPEVHVGDGWKPHLTIDIPAAPASFEDMPLESPVLKKHQADHLGEEIQELAANHGFAPSNLLASELANNELAASPIEMVAEDPQDYTELAASTDLVIGEELHEYITINLANGCQRMIDITGMTDEEIDAAVEAAYEEFAMDLEFDCPEELRHLYV